MRMKGKRHDHIVPLSQQVLRLLAELRTYTGHCALLFPGRNNEKNPISQNTMIYAMYRMGYHNRATVHGFRSTASTILNEEKIFSPDAIERQLAHIEANKVRAAYDRSHHMEERKRIMQWWSDFIDSLGGKNVIQLTKKFKCE